MTTAVTTVVLAVEARQQEHIDTEQGSTPRVDYRPTGVVLLNDGVFRHWLAPGETYRLERDAIGWVVTCRSWTGGHTYRLSSEETGAYLFELPTADGAVDLLDGQVYEIAESAPYQGWELRQR